MARWLDLPIIAEGVETKEQADYLKSIGCRMMQGYYFSRPLPAEKFEPIYLSSGNTAEFADKKVDVSRAEPFWTAANQNALIFNSFLGGAAIIEYHNGNLELLRANDRFFSIINATRREYESWMTHFRTGSMVNTAKSLS